MNPPSKRVPASRRPMRQLTPHEKAAHLVLARRVRALRVGKGWSQNQLADFSGFARSYLSHILAGEVSPTLRMLARLAAALEVSVGELFAGD